MVTSAEDRSHSWTIRELAFLTLVVLAFVFEVCVLFVPDRMGFDRFPLRRNAFSDIPPVKPVALPLLLVTVAGVLAAGVKWLPSLARRPRRAVGGLFAVGLGLHFAMLGSLQEGFQAFHRRTVFTAHNQFLYEAVLVRDLTVVVKNYEAYAQPRAFLAQKGQAVLALYYGMRVAANSPLLRDVLESAAAPADEVKGWLDEFGLSLTAAEIEEARLLQALMFILFPILTYLPLFFMYWLGRATVDAPFGLLAATLYLFVPAVAFNVAHLDFALFPLLAMATITLFVIGVTRRRVDALAGAAVVFTAYFTMTLGAGALGFFFASFMLLNGLAGLRQGDARRRIVVDAARVAGVFAVIGGMSLALLYATLNVDLLERYANARAIQRDWITSKYSMFWVITNVLGYLISFGLTQAALVVAQQGRSLGRFHRSKDDAFDHVVLAWLFLLIGLIAFGRQHGETNRIWAFLSPLACLIAARLMYDSLPARRYLPPLIVFLIGLILSRYRLSYL